MSITEERASAPPHLAGSKSFWVAAVGENPGLGPDELKLLECACEQLDVIAQARNRIRRDGAVVEKKPSGNLAPHPAVAMQKQATLRLQSILRQLQLGIDTEDLPPVVPRRPGRRPAGDPYSPRRAS